MKKINITDIPSQYVELAEFLGLEKFMEICEYFGGSHIYIPKSETVKNIARDRDIIKSFDSGVDIRTLARENKVSTNCIRKIIKKNKRNLY